MGSEPGGFTSQGGSVSDLYNAIAFCAEVSVLLLMWGCRIGRNNAPVTRLTCQLGMLVTITLYGLFLWNRPLLTKLLPVSNVIILSNWLPIAGSFFIGIYLTTTAIARFRRIVVGGLTLSIVAFSFVSPLLGSAPTCSELEEESLLVHQTTPFTCSPAVAASLLRLHGVSATESELAGLCLTRKGTHWMGLYRGLVIKTQATEWNVVAEEYSPQALFRLQQHPCILALDFNTDAIPEGRELGFHEETGHSVLVLRTTNDQQLDVFDPSPHYGMETWDVDILQYVRSGVILRLVPRDKTAVSSRHVAGRIRRSLASYHIAAR